MNGEAGVRFILLCLSVGNPLGFWKGVSPARCSRWTWSNAATGALGGTPAKAASPFPSPLFVPFSFFSLKGSAFLIRRKKAFLFGGASYFIREL